VAMATLCSAASYTAPTYEEASPYMTFQGPWTSGSNPTVQLQIVRLGNIVTIHFPPVSASCTVVSTAASTSTLAGQFHPAVHQLIAITGQDNGGYGPGFVKIWTTGDISIERFNAGATTTFTASGASCGTCFDVSVTYSLL